MFDATTTTSAEQRQQIADVDQLLTGPTSTQAPQVDAESGLVAPPWWDGDDDASDTNLRLLQQTRMGL